MSTQDQSPPSEPNYFWPDDYVPPGEVVTRHEGKVAEAVAAAELVMAEAAFREAEQRLARARAATGGAS